MRKLTRSSYKLLMASIMIHTHFRNVLSDVERRLQRNISVSYVLRNIRAHSWCVGLALVWPFTFPCDDERYSHVCEQTALLTPNAERNSASLLASIVELVVRLIGELIGIWCSISQPSNRKAEGAIIIVSFFLPFFVFSRKMKNCAGVRMLPAFTHHAYF